MKLKEKLKLHLTDKEIKEFIRPVKNFDIINVIYKIGLQEPILIENMIKMLDNDNFFYFSNNNKQTITDIINTDKLYFSDIECVNGKIQKIIYEPFKTLFKTSGKIIIENDLRDEFLKKNKKSEYFDLNTIKDSIKYSQSYADRGLLHGYIGNSCPKVYYSKEEEIILIGVDYDEKTFKDILPNNTYNKLTSIITDLWWYSICDVNSIKNPEKYQQYEITAGTWELEHYYGISELGWHEKMPYAKLKLLK